MPAQNTDISITSLRGGANNTDPPNSLPEDQCVLAENCEFFSSMMGERRNGCAALNIAGTSILNETVVCHLSQWYPLNDVLNPEFIVGSATPTASIFLTKRTLGVWSDITQNDAIDFSNNDIYKIQTQALTGELFIAYHSAVDRLHVWDSTILRRAGIAQPAAPTAADEGIGVTFKAVRYYRVRYTLVAGGIVIARSEPSLSLTFTPSGTGAGATITKPANLTGETYTNWEIEASADNATFYVLASQIIGTTTYTDTVQDFTQTPVPAVSYNASGPLSEAIGSYTLLPSAKYLAVDGDRLVFAGHWTDVTRQSQIGWTPVTTDPGVGNHERFPIVTTGGTPIVSSLQLDNYNGGPITGIASSVYGSWYAFKWDHIYMLVRTGDPTSAYSVITLSQTQGAIPGSIVKGVDENGSAVIYFLDPALGPSRVGPGGIEVIDGQYSTWGRVNLEAANVQACGIFYPYKQQVHWWVPVDGADSPNLKMILQVSSIQQVSGVTAGAGGVGRGWSTATGLISQAFCASVFTELVTINSLNSISERPFIGLTSTGTAFVQRCDVEITDNGTTYLATILTKPYFVTGLLNRWGVMNVALLATANATATMNVSIVRDFGVETSQTVAVSLAPVGSETFVVKSLDNLVMSGATAIQFQFTG